MKTITLSDADAEWFKVLLTVLDDCDYEGEDGHEMERVKDSIRKQLEYKK